MRRGRLSCVDRQTTERDLASGDEQLAAVAIWRTWRTRPQHPVSPWVDIFGRVCCQTCRSARPMRPSDPVHARTRCPLWLVMAGA